MYSIINLKVHGDNRGSLISLEEMKEIPFSIKRVYYIFDTKEGVARGFHAHKKLNQVLVCVSGACTIKLDNGENTTLVKLEEPNQGLLIGNMIWREMFDFTQDCVLMVIADQYYDEKDYIRDYKEFIKMLKG